MKPIFAIAAILVFYSGCAYSDLKECLSTVSEYNRGMPVNVGNGVTVNGMGCKEEDGRVVLFYNSKIDTTTSSIKSIGISGPKNQRTISTCTSPNMRGLLEYYDMEWIYYDSRSSAFIGSIKVKKEHCPK